MLDWHVIHPPFLLALIMNLDLLRNNLSWHKIPPTKLTWRNKYEHDISGKDSIIEQNDFVVITSVDMVYR